MISFDEAITIARQHKGNINTCTEYERGYVFGSTEDDAFIGGLDRQPIGIMKEGGQVLSMIAFIEADPGQQIGDIKHLPQFGYIEPDDYFPPEVRKMFEKKNERD